MKNKKMTEGKTSTDGVGDMALKDYKYAFVPDVIYKNKIGKILYKQCFGDYIVMDFGYGDSSVGIMPIRRIKKYFKSKSQALKFAKSYMRTH
jgi:hypothetical protein